MGDSLFEPPSTTKTDSAGSTSASLAATTQAEVPPIPTNGQQCVNSMVSGLDTHTSCHDNVNFVKPLWKLSEQSHGGSSVLDLRIAELG